MSARTDDRALEEAGAILGALARRDEPIGSRTTYRVGGSAALFVEVDDEAALALVTKAVTKSEIGVLIIGKGSNLLVADRGYDGLVVVLGIGYDRVDVTEEQVVEVGGATALPVLARRSAQAGARGLEWAVGIPGSVGGAVAMNAGGHGSDVASCLVDASIVHLRGGGAEQLSNAQLAFSYRHSALQRDDLVLAARFRAFAGDPAAGAAAIDEIVRWRREHQPGGRNAGSVFTNPAGDSAGRLIDACGLKGLRIGSAAVSEKHANFFQVDEGGSAADVVGLMEEVRRLVAERSGIELVAEVRLVGFDR